MAYYQAENTGKGFITHAENETNFITGHPANIWETENTAWAERHGLTAITKEQAQALIDESLKDRYPDDYEDESLRGQLVPEEEREVIYSGSIPQYILP